MTLKLSYFDAEGFGEALRLCLVVAGVEFIDNRIAYPDWPEFKKTTPNGTVPLLEVDGKVMTENYAIWKYICLKFGLLPESAKDIYTCDEIFETICDARKYMSLMVAMYSNPESLGLIDVTEDEKKERSENMLKLWNTENIPASLARLNEICVNTGFLYDGKKITGADIMVYCHLRALAGGFFPTPKDIYNKYEN